MSTDTERITLRLPPDLHRKLVDAAGLAGRSLNTEIVRRLYSTFGTPGREAAARISAGDALEKIPELVRRIEALEKKRGK